MERYTYNVEEPESRLEGLPRLAALAAEATNPSSLPEQAFDSETMGIPQPVTAPEPLPSSTTHGPPSFDIQKPRRPVVRRTPAPPQQTTPYIAPDILMRVRERTRLAIASLTRYIDDARANPEGHLLRPAQLPVFESLLRGLEEEGHGLKGYVSLPTGSGKSVIYTRFVRLTSMQTLIVAPTKHLVKGVDEAFNKFNKPGERSVRVGQIDGTSTQSHEHVTATTYASFIPHSLRPRPGSGLRPDYIDLLILDESHNAMAPQARRAVGQYPHAVQLGFTATENYSDKRKLSALLPREIHKLTILEACSFGLISPYSNWVVETGLDISTIRINSTNEYDAGDLQGHINNPDRNRLIADLYKQRFGGKKAFVFCSGIEHAQDMSIMFNRMGVPAAAVYGKGMHDDERDDILRSARSRKRGSTMVLCSDRMLLEGTDIEEFSVCLNAVPVLGSYVRAKQRPGRALRLDKHDPNKHAIVVDIIDSDYRTAPLLFCDEEIGQTAHVGERQAHADESIPFGDGRAAILITDPDRVEAMAEAFVERRSAGKGPTYPTAPTGWIGTAELAAELGVKPQMFRNRLGAVKAQDAEHYSENTGLFQLPPANCSLFFSPQLAASIHQQRDTLFALSLMEPPPPYWLSPRMVEARYGTTDAADVLSDIAEELGEGAGEYRLPKMSAPGVYYSPDVIRKYAESIEQTYIPPDAPPPSWEVLGDISSVHGQRDQRHFIALLTARNRSLMLSHAITIGENTYCHPGLMRHCAKITQQPSGWLTLEQAAASRGIAADTLRGRMYEQYDASSVVLLRNWIPDLKGGGYMSPWFAEMIDAAPAPTKERQ